MVNSKQIRILTTLLLTLLCSLPITAAGNPKLSSPIYLATVLVNKPTLDDMKDLCHYYSLTPAPEEDGYTVFTTPDGYESSSRFVPNRTHISLSKNRLTLTKN